MLWGDRLAQVSLVIIWDRNEVRDSLQQQRRLCGFSIRLILNIAENANPY